MAKLFHWPLKIIKEYIVFIAKSSNTPAEKKLFTLIPLNALAEQLFFHFAKKVLHPYISDRTSKINKAVNKALSSLNEDPIVTRQATS